MFYLNTMDKTIHSSLPSPDTGATSIYIWMRDWMRVGVELNLGLAGDTDQPGHSYRRWTGENDEDPDKDW